MKFPWNLIKRKKTLVPISRSHDFIIESDGWVRSANPEDSTIKRDGAVRILGEIKE